MFNSIDWGNYIAIIVILLVAWYLYVGIVYYAKDIRQWVSKILHKPHDKNLIAFAPNNNQQAIQANDTNDFFAAAHQLRNNIESVFTKAISKGYLKEELIVALRLTVKHYQYLKPTAFRVAINNYVEQESEHQCSIRLSEEELGTLWIG